MSRQTTNQAAQRAKVSRRRRFRGAPEKQHGERSQSGVKVRSTAGWRAYLVRRGAAVKAAAEHDDLIAGWRAREAEKLAAKQAAAK